MLVSVTGPGAEVLPWQNGKVLRGFAYRWNVTASDRYSRLWKAATLSADRLIRRAGYQGRLPVRVANVWALHKRGVWHVHEGLPGGSKIELMWSRQVVAFIDHVRKRESRIDGRERWALLEIERNFGIATRGFYGWGFIDRNPLRQGAVGAVYVNEKKAAAYLARNVAGYLGENASEEAVAVGRVLRSYVSRRLTKITGVTLTNLRRAHYLWVIIRDGLELPMWDRDVLERVWSLLANQGVSARAP